jgi:hypothetical protein
MQRLILVATAILIFAAFPVAELKAEPHASREAAIALLRSGGILGGDTRVANAAWSEKGRFWIISLRHPSGKITKWTVDAEAKNFEYICPD